MFPQEVDVINIALILPVFSAAVVKTTPVWVLCVLGNSRGGGWLDGGGQRYACKCVRACGCMCVGYMRTIVMAFAAQPWWADVMLGSVVFWKQQLESQLSFKITARRRHHGRSTF